MPEFIGRLGPVGRVAILVSRYNERVTARLLEGARQCCREARIADRHVDVYWTSGAFELPVMAEELARSGQYACLVALGAVIRGETPHFEFVAGETTRGLGAVARMHVLPVGFGLLTADTMQQALDRAGGPAGNKGFEAAEAAISAADTLARIRRADAPT
jgi:6,7-dimethyl-8-ribityllumazine synthase